MSRKKRKSKPNPPAGRRDHRHPGSLPGVRTGDSGENVPNDHDGGGSSRAVEAMTVAWMLSFMASILGEVGTLISTVLLMAVGRGKDTPGLLAMVPGVLWFVSIVTGTCCLVLTFVVYRLRAAPPPASLIRAAVIVGALPWLAILLTWVAQIAR